MSKIDACVFFPRKRSLFRMLLELFWYISIVIAVPIEAFELVLRPAIDAV